jgi:hypothetical protein
MDQVIGQALATYRKLSQDEFRSDQSATVAQQGARSLQRV